MKGYQVAVAALAVLLVITVGILFYVLADWESGGGEASQTAGSQRQAVGETGTRDGYAPAPGGTAAVDRDEDIEADIDDEPVEACHHCGGAGTLPCGVCSGDGIMPYDCPRCGGSGWVQPSPVDPMLVRCSDCGGTGELQVPCSNCGGDGDVRCSHCGGSGLEP